MGHFYKKKWDRPTGLSHEPIIVLMFAYVEVGFTAERAESAEGNMV